MIATLFIISMAAHFGVGAARSFFTGRGIFRSGFDMFIVGFGIAAIGFFIKRASVWPVSPEHVFTIPVYGDYFTAGSAGRSG